MPDKTFAVSDSPPNQGAIARLEGRGKRVIRLPSPSIVVRQLPEEDARIICRLDRFDWIMIEDVRTASDLEEIAAGTGLDLFDLDEVKICAAGEPAADRLRFCQVHSDLIPAGPDPKLIVEGMTAYEGGTLRGVSVLSLGSSEDDRGLAEGLAAAGAEVTRIVVHEETGEVPQIDGRTKSLLIAGGVDAVYFVSSVDVADLASTFRRAGIDFLPDSVGAFCGDRETRTALAEHGIESDLFPIY